MHILLPPSEGKATPKSGRPVDLSGLSLPALTPARARVLESLVALCAEPASDQAREVLGLGPTQAEEIARNARVRDTPAMPARKLYTGVLYDALDLASLSTPARRRADRAILVFSGLWGAVRLGDRIPAYRCPVGSTLPGVGALGAYWRTAMPEVLAEVARKGLVLDLRSSAYVTMWTPPRGEVARRTAVVRVLHEREVNGVLKRSVVSHFNKATKGRLVRDLLTSGARPSSPAALVEVLQDLKYTVESHPSRGDRPVQLDLIVTEL
ncbi:peroxide stress protein YaaA [Actinopolymorpha alba]|uniref:peroxide stress protein YaaA n=1 Tax=Actinopolymorpha alba TaxID=533267 RepID=UPI0003667320|nr:peroxide stress protein YaaA [Actinopolymorpha alba]